jgi:hypothetical protein
MLRTPTMIGPGERPEPLASLPASLARRQLTPSRTSSVVPNRRKACSRLTSSISRLLRQRLEETGFDDELKDLAKGEL